MGNPAPPPGATDMAPGTRIRITHVGDGDPRLRPGMEGTVTEVGTGYVAANWDDATVGDVALLRTGPSPDAWEVLPSDG